jgi:hypothetical protein
MTPANKVAIDEAELRTLWAQAPAVSTEEMLARFGCCRSTLQLRAKLLGLPRRTPRKRRRTGPIYHYAHR